MEQKEAIALLRHKDFDLSSYRIWIDAGSGDGLFTLALASLLDREGTIHAIDINQKLLNKIPGRFDNITIQKWKLDFVTQKLPIESVDGVLMANSLHYVQDKNALIRNLSALMPENGCFLVVEYDTDDANPWIPYPVSFHSLRYIFEEAGFRSVRKLHTHSSVYNNAGFYSAAIER